MQEENLIAAVLLEQAALNLLHTHPPAVRKWAFHLVLAALRFSNCQQPRLANRAYRSGDISNCTLYSLPSCSLRAFPSATLNLAQAHRLCPLLGGCFFGRTPPLPPHPLPPKKHDDGLALTVTC